MTFLQLLKLFGCLVGSAGCFYVFLWLLNQPSDLAATGALLLAMIYFWLVFYSRFFTQNPFKKHP